MIVSSKLIVSSLLLESSESSEDMIIPINTSYLAGNITGYKPSRINYDGYPLFIYTTGTAMFYKSKTAISYTKYMAINGFIAVSAEYDVLDYPFSCDEWFEKAEKLWDQNVNNSLINVLCNNENLELNINCTKGIVLSGFSQGAQLTLLAPKYNGNQINGMYIMGGGDKLFGRFDFTQCLSFDTLNTESSKIRSMVGENDIYFGKNINGVRIQQNSISGTICDDDYTTDCLQNDGSGWYIIQEFETSSGTAPHCYAYKNTDCHSGQWDDHYINDDPLKQKQRKWSQQKNLQWLIEKVYHMY